MSDFFDLPEDSFVSKSGNYEKKDDPNVYNPDPNSFNGKYQSVFRFVPYIFDKKLSKYTKYSAKFWNPLTKDALFVDCPSTVGKPSILWDLDTVIRSLEKEEPKLWEKLKERFSRWHTNHSAIYIKKDPQRPDLEGQVKIFKFSSKINDLIEGEINPEGSELIENLKKVNPYHLLEGKDFLCIVGKKTKKFRDWDKCEFMKDVTPFIFKIKDKKVVVKNEEKSVKLVQEFFKKNTPKIDPYLYKEWTDETYEKVAEAIVSTIGNKAVIKLVLDRTKDDKIKKLILQKMEVSEKGKSSVDENLEFDSEDKLDASDEKDPFIDTNDDAGDNSDSTGSSSEEDDEYDKLFKDM